MKQWYTCSNMECDYKSNEYPMVIRIYEMENEIGTRCPVCGKVLLYNAQ